MELIEGKVIDPLEDVSAVEKVARVLDYFATLQHTIPGTLCGGTCHGLLFPDTGDLVFDSLDAMGFNSRLFAHNPKLTFQGCELVFCHLDIAPRNILWLEDGFIGLIDWASAGYYPRLFEFYAQWCIEGKDGALNSLLLNSMNRLPDQEMAQKEPLLCAWRNIQKYSFQSKKAKPDEILSRDPTSFVPAPPPPMPEYPRDWYEQGLPECSTSTRPA